MVISPHTQVTCEDQMVVAGPLGSAIMGRQSLDNLRHWCAILCRSQQLIRWHLTSSGCTLKNIGEDWSRIMDDVLEGSSCDSRVPRYTLEGGDHYSPDRMHRTRILQWIETWMHGNLSKVH